MKYYNKIILFLSLIILFCSSCATKSDNPIGPILNWVDSGTQTINLADYTKKQSFILYDFDNGTTHNFAIPLNGWISYWSDIRNATAPWDPNTTPTWSGFCLNSSGFDMEFGFTNMRPDPS